MIKEDQAQLFSEKRDQGDRGKKPHAPLSVRMRPTCLSEVIGQEHILGKDCLLPRLIKTDCFGSILLYGPPGCGKTTLAEVIAKETKSKCVRINAVLSNVAELRDVLRMARYTPEERTIVFIDEIHRFNKAQQDLLLPDVEEGNIRLIGATTHNPGFYINAPLLSRSHLFRLEPVPHDVMARVLEKALRAKEGLGAFKCEAEDGVLEGLANLCEGDMRRALNALETIVLSQAIGSVITEDSVAVFAKERQIRYDANEDEHYNTISAYIKSIRGNDPDAALYWMAKMLEGGEDPRFIARRLVIFASEDVGLADSRGLSLAAATFQACEWIGLPECAINLAHATVFLATAPKSNTAYLAGIEARKAIKTGSPQQVPSWLRDGHSSASRKMGDGKGYLYSHDYDSNISGQDYMLKPIQFYKPKAVGAESNIAERLAEWKALKKKMSTDSSNPR